MRSSASQPASDNTAIGFEALFSNTTGNNNTATGFGALFNNTTGAKTRPTVMLRFQNNTTGNDNTATGFDAHHLNTTGHALQHGNTANGLSALYTTPPATTTRPTVLVRSSATPPASTTRPTVI